MVKRKGRKSRGIPRRSELEKARKKQEGINYLALFLLLVALVANVIALIMLLKLV